MSSDAPDYSAILDNLYIGNLAAAKTLHQRPELGITHVLSVCPDYPEGEEARQGTNAVGGAACRTVHRCLAIEDSEFEDILSLLPSAIAFIKGALEPQNSSGKFTGQKTEVQSRRGKREADLGLEEASGSVPRQKHKVLVHCVMGISRSTTVVCAYLMATRHLSFPSALMLIRRRRPQVHPNYGFRRQLQIFGECGYFTDYSGPIRTHPAYTTWQRKKKREVAKYLGRLENIVEIKLDDETEPGVSLTDDFPTDQLEAASLLSEIGATHLLTVAPASLPSSLTHPPSGALKARRPSGLVSPFLSPAASSMSPSDSTAPSPMSSRSSSFSNSSRTSSSLSNASTAATSVLSLPSLLPPSKLRLEVSSSDSDEESENELEYSIEPDYLTLAGVEHHHIAVKDTDTIGLLLRLGEASLFIQHALDEEGSESDQDLSPPNRNNNSGRRHVLIHCSTEARACTVVCAYLMSCKGLKPSQAYSIIENAQPLFNPTKQFVTLLELFHDCDYDPTLDHPRVQSWLSGVSKPKVTHTPSIASNSRCATRRPNHPPASVHWEMESDKDDESICLHHKLGTPMRAGSFSNAYMQQFSSGNSSRRPSHSAGVSGNALRPSGTPGGLDVGALLQRFQGVGDPDFAFDVEAFRGALRGIAADTDRKSGRCRTAP